MLLRRDHWFILALAVGLAAPTISSGCSAGAASSGDPSDGGSGAGTNTGAGQNTGGGQNSGGADTTTGFDVSATVGSGGTGGVPINECGTECGPMEICDGIHKGLDDNCNGQIDEGCACTPGSASSCFKGDPSYRDDIGCLPGTMKCTESGVWGSCDGGAHATDNPACYLNNPTGCGPTSALPFETKSLKDGTGNFDDNAVTEQFEVDCPSGVNPCPSVTGASFQPLVSGEYTVTYTKNPGTAQEESCVFPLYVGTRGLRVELSWNYPMAPNDVDLDLHVHEPGTTTPWDLDGGENQDCGYANCKLIPDFFGGPPDPSGLPDWFMGVAPPDPVDWSPIEMPLNLNTCYNAPRDAGEPWSDLGMGCHNPRLDIDNINCDPAIVDVTNDDFCAAENTNVDYPPTNTWTRIGVDYYSNHGFTQNILPNVKIYCDGRLAAELGSQGFFNPEQPVNFVSGDNGKFWNVAEVRYVKDACQSTCEVRPIYANGDTNERFPLIVTQTAAETTFTPPYPL